MRGEEVERVKGWGNGGQGMGVVVLTVLIW